MERGESANSVAHGWAPHGSHHVRFRLAPGDTKEVIFLLGYWENPDDQKFDPLWLVLGAAAYLKETGDEAILDEAVPYADAQDGLAPLCEHLERSLRYTSDRLARICCRLSGERTGTTA